MPRHSSNQSSAQAQQDIVSEGIENFELPKALVTKIAKSAIPENTKLQKESILSLVKGSTVFINYLAATAHDVAVSKQHKSISASDVLKALEMIEFGDLVETLNAELQVYRELAKTDKSKKGNANVGVGAAPPGGVPGAEGSTAPAGAASASNTNGNSISSSGNSNGTSSGTPSSLPPIKLKVSSSASSPSPSSDKDKGKSKAFDTSSNSASSKVVIIGPGGNSNSPSAVGSSARFGSAPYVSSPLARGSTTGPVPMDVDDDSSQLNGIPHGGNTTANDDDDTEDEERAQGGNVEEYDEGEDEDSGEQPGADEDDEEEDEDEGEDGGAVDEDDDEDQEGDEESVDRMQVEGEEVRRDARGPEDHATASGHGGHADDDD